MAYGAKQRLETSTEPVTETWALKALKSFLGFDPAPILVALQTEIPETAQKMKDGIDSLVQSMKNIDARLAAIERHFDISGQPLAIGNGHDRPGSTVDGDPASDRR